MSYNDEIQEILDNVMGNYRGLNTFVMNHTIDMINNSEVLSNSVNNTNNKSYMISSDEMVDNIPDGKTTNIIISKKRSFEAALDYKDGKTLVLNFASNHSIGGSPWTAGAQEESLCRISTLYPCLKKYEESFYSPHRKQFINRIIDEYGNDDIIYLPDITVFKTDDSAPLLLDEDKYYNVDVITCAAPDLPNSFDMNKYRTIMYRRIKRIVQIAKKEKVNNLILGAFGCGAYHNPPEVVASLFKRVLRDYHFDNVEFAVYCRDDNEFSNYNIFKNILEK